MKNITFTSLVRLAMYPLPSRRVRRCVPFAAFAFATASLTSACAPEASCAETATCPPSDDDRDASPDRSGLDGSGDHLNRGDAAVTNDLSPDRPTVDAQTSDIRHDDSADGSGQETPDGGRADANADTFDRDSPAFDATIDNRNDRANPTDIETDMAESGATDASAPDASGPNDAPGADVSTSDVADGGATPDVAIGCNATTCPTGCCDANGKCVASPSHDACGMGGATCQACGSGQECNGTSCVCTPTSCASGCCSGTACIPFAQQTTNSCGSAGAVCAMCGSDQKCNGTGVCAAVTWCDSQSRPAGVAPNDYQCLDFDTGMPPTNVWVPTLQGPQCILDLATDHVQSAPNALHARTTPVDEMNPIEPIAQLLWTVGGERVSAVIITSDIYPIQLHGGGKTKADYLCLRIGSLKGCLTYAEPSALGALALTFPEGTSGPGYPFCELTAPVDVPADTWTRITLRLTDVGVLSLSEGGATTTCASNITASSGVAAVQIGSRAEASSANFGDVHLDNVATYVER